ncbi:glycosyl hydrolase [Paenibacillus sp. CN-4]|uniref:glycosyl hydrolase n=1 Tax=Paenibacillus nanchangensis TaxID=3348343 RepID=UPI00397E2337
MTLNTKRMYRLFSTVLPILVVLSLLPWGEGSKPDTPAEGEVPVPARTGAAVPSGQPVKPINPDASPEARELLEELSSLSGKGMISGQHDYLESPDEFSNKLNQTAGQHALLHGYELGPINNQSKSTIAWQRQNVVDSAIRWHDQGGIVAMTFHQALPGRSPAWSNVTMPLSQNMFDAYVTPGTPEYKQLISDLDEVAGYLKQLKEAGVPVLWRPYHEMNGGWFWWGQKDNFTALWDLMYNRFTGTHQLNNLLWVWNPNAPNEWADPYETHFPGIGKVDILAADIYNNDFKQSYHDDLLKLAGGKPIAIGESGELPDPDLMAGKQNQWVYMMTWGKMLTENNSTQDIKKFMTHPFTVSMEKRLSVPSPGKTAPAERPGSEQQDNTQKDNPQQDNAQQGTGLRGEYFNNTELRGKPALVREDANVDFNWRGDAPAPVIAVDEFSVRWTGKLKPAVSGEYSFTASSDDGIRVWIGGRLIIDNWETQSGVDRKGSLSLKSGETYDIKVEYFEQHGDANVQLKWKPPGRAESVIPGNVLFLP